jgi:hypothetical protein
MYQRPARASRPHRSAGSLVLSLAVLPVALASLTGCGASSKPSAATTPVSAATVSPPAAQPLSFELVEHDTGTVYTPKGGSPKAGGPTGQPMPGDRLAITADFLRNGQKAGTGHYTNTFQAGNTIVFDGVISLSDGQLVGRGTVPFTEPTVVPVVSGTGAYAGRTGTISATGTGPNEAKLTVVLK